MKVKNKEIRFVEDSFIALPLIKDSIPTFGDLWDCHHSKFSGFNLFSNPLEKKHLTTRPLRKLNYSLTHVKNAEDKLATVNVDGEISIEVLSGLINVQGSGQFEKQKTKKWDEENLICQYYVENYSVGFIPQAKEMTNGRIVNQLLTSELNATHVVRDIILGAEVNAHISIAQAGTAENKNVEGIFSEGIPCGAVNASLKASLKWLDLEQGSNFEKKITIHSQPPIPQQPSTIKDMFDLIEQFDSFVSNEQHYEFISSDIIGVPIRFMLVPIAQIILDVKVEKLYMQLNDNIMEDFRAMLIILQDFQSIGYIKGRVLEIENRLRIILLDPNSPLSNEISAYEKELQEVTNDYFERAYEAIIKYKNAQVKSEELLKIVRGHSACEYSRAKVYAKVEAFVINGKKELSCVHENDATQMKAVVSYFTNRDSLEGWKRSEIGIKILLNTHGDSFNGTFHYLYKMSKALEKHKIEVGIALPSISDNFNLSIKINEEQWISYEAADIPRVLGIVYAAIDTDVSIENRFYTLNASLLRILLPLEDLRDLVKLISFVTNNSRKLYIVRSYMGLLERCSNIDNSQWKFFVLLDALDTALDAIQQLRNFASLEIFAESEWIVGELGLPDMHAAPLLFVLRDGDIKAICLDRFDIQILFQLFKGSDNPDLSTLSPNSLHYSLYPDRALFAMKVIKIINQNKKNYGLDSIKLKIPSFNEKPENILVYTLGIVRSTLSGNCLDVISEICRHVIKDHIELVGLLTKNGWSDANRKFNTVMDAQNCESLRVALLKWLESKEPFAAKIEYARETVKRVIMDSTEDNISEVQRTIEDIIYDPQCSNDIKTIASWQESGLKNQYVEIENILNMYSTRWDNEETFHIMAIISLLKQVVELSGDELSMPSLHEIRQKYIKRLPQYNDNDYKQEIDESIVSSPYHTVSLLANFQYDHRLHKLHQQLDQISVNDKNDMISMFSLLEELNYEQREDLWQNSRFLYLVQIYLDRNEELSPLISLCPRSDDNLSFPRYIPRNICKRLEEFHEVQDFPVPDMLNDLEQAKKFFKSILYKQEIPEKFQLILSKSIRQNTDLEEKFQSAGALFYWDPDKKIFTEPWDLKTIKSAFDQLKIDHLIADPKNSPSTDPICILNISNGNEDFTEDHHNKVLTINKHWQQTMGKTMAVVAPNDYVKVREIITCPTVSITQETVGISIVLPYILQKVKMLGCDILNADNISRLIAAGNKSASVQNNGPVFGKKIASNDPGPITMNKPLSTQKKNSLARLDCIVGMLSSVDCTVAEDIIRVIAKFPLALPLVMPDLEQEKKYRVMLPLLIGPLIKWETNPGMIIEHYLFTNPFKLLVTVRLGTNPIGKSAILNQLLNTKYMFSSSAEPGAFRGPPYTLSGTVEFTWLTRETCCTGLWKSVLERYYENGKNEIVLLANLHGEALEYMDQVKLLKQLASKFIVFAMPDCDENKWQQFLEIVDPDKVDYLTVDSNDPDNDNYNIKTQYLMSDTTLAKVRSKFEDALKGRSTTLNLETIELGESLQLSEGIECEESSLLINFIKKQNCFNIRGMMQLQKQGSIIRSYQNIKVWKDSQLQELMTLYGNILSLPLGKRRKAMAHLERDISQLSAKESSDERANIVRLKEELMSIVDFTNKNKIQEKQIKARIEQSMTRVDNVSLGLEHFFRELGQIYEITLISPPHPMNNGVLQLPERYAELLISGHSIELLNGDDGTIPDAWLTAIFKHVCRKIPKMRIYVVSILGLQSSGKSTLLNALFACRFVVSVGRCTRGLFMRLLLLEQNLRDKLGIDAILLIDTEGLGAPEKVNDPDAERKDRLLATFAMGISDLTIINVLGEYMRDLTEILQIAIVAMARLEKAEMTPDILLVQHLTERDTRKSSSGVDQFCKALQNALDLANQKDVEMGILNSKCLQRLSQRVRAGQLLKQFRPFKNGASANAPPSEEYHHDVVNLYKSILDESHKSKSKMTFSQWHSLIQSYWASVSSENFAVRFKNIKEIYEFIERGKRINVVQEAIEIAFQVHQVQLKKFIQMRVLNYYSEGKMTEADLRKRCLENISKIMDMIPMRCSFSSYECKECDMARKERRELEIYVENKHCELDTSKTINNFISRKRQSNVTMLKQMLEAAFLRQGYSTEFKNVITRRLKGELEKMPASQISEENRTKIAEEIWNELRQIAASKDTVLPVNRVIVNEIQKEYRYGENFVSQIVAKQKPNLSRINAYTKTTLLIRKEECFLEEYEVYKLETQLEGLAGEIMRKYDSDHFEPRMVHELQKQVTQIVEKFAKEFKRDLLPDFKLNLHAYALLNFQNDMEEIQKKWDRKYKPLAILEQREKEYRKLIDSRLQFGYSSDSEGNVIGTFLLKAIIQKAEEAGNYARRQAVLDLPWTTNSESVRLKYFAQLAEEVKEGNLRRALRHFQSPENEITRWYSKMVDSNTGGNELKKFNETFDSEIRHVNQEIRNCSSIEAIKDYVVNYLTNNEIEYQMETTNIDLELLQKSIVKVLDDPNNKVTMTSKDLKDPSKDELVMGRLGCTKGCFWCGALCWGSWEHDGNNDDTKKHHTCHQPGGLAKTNYVKNKRLVAEPCHLTLDTTIVHYGGHRIPWAEAKRTTFKDWKFDPHINTKFNDLMCWFFTMLQNKLAEERNLAPADPIEMQQYKNLDYRTILVTLKENI